MNRPTFLNSQFNILNNMGSSSQSQAGPSGYGYGSVYLVRAYLSSVVQNLTHEND